MSLVKDMKRLVDHIMTISLIKKAINNNDLTNAEKVNKVLIYLNDLDRNLKEVEDEKKSTEKRS